MYVYLVNVKDGEHTRVVPDVTLRHGCIPVIGNTSPLDSLDHETESVMIEPAVWFKVLILDSVTIDCNRRCIQWSTEPIWNINRKQKSFTKRCVGTYGVKEELVDSLQSNSTTTRLSRTLFSQGECYDFNSDLDELFDYALEMLEKYKVKSITDAQFHGMLLRLLHCYIFPAIKLTRDDLGLLEVAYKEQEEKIAKMDEKINVRNEDIARIRKTKKNQRSQILQVWQEGNSGTPSDVVLKTLLSDLDRDIREAETDLDFTQNLVEEAKSGSASPEELERRRCERNEAHNIKESLLKTRENIRQGEKQLTKQKSWIESLRSRRSKGSKAKSKTLIPLCDIFLALDRRANDQRKKCEKLMERKVLALSVKEAIRMAIEDLKNNAESTGLEVLRGSTRRATDVLQNAHIPSEWMTLSEKVDNMVNNPNHKLGQRHAEFCSSIVGQCVELRNKEWSVFQHSPAITTDRASLRNSFALCETIEDQLATLTNTESYVIIDCAESEQKTPKQAVEHIRDNIKQHFEMMTADLQDALGYCSESIYNKLWLCYETHFYEFVLPTLVDLYQFCYRDTCTMLELNLGSLTYGELEVQEPWLLDLLQNQHRKESGFLEEEDEENASPDMVEAPIGNTEGTDQDVPTTDHCDQSETDQPVTDHADQEMKDTDQAHFTLQQQDSGLETDTDVVTTETSGPLYISETSNLPGVSDTAVLSDANETSDEPIAVKTGSFNGGICVSTDKGAIGESTPTVWASGDMRMAVSETSSDKISAVLSQGTEQDSGSMSTFCTPMGPNVSDSVQPVAFPSQSAVHSVVEIHQECAGTPPKHSLKEEWKPEETSNVDTAVNIKVHSVKEQEISQQAVSEKFPSDSTKDTPSAEPEHVIPYRRDSHTKTMRRSKGQVYVFDDRQPVRLPEQGFDLEDIMIKLISSTEEDDQRLHGELGENGVSDENVGGSVQLRNSEPKLCAGHATLDLGGDPASVTRRSSPAILSNDPHQKPVLSPSNSKPEDENLDTFSVDSGSVTSGEETWRNTILSTLNSFGLETSSSCDISQHRDGDFDCAVKLRCQVKDEAPADKTFCQVFQPVIESIGKVLDEKTPLAKLQQLTCCLRLINSQVSRIRARRNEGNVSMCADDMVTVLTLALLYCDPATVSALYPTVVLLSEIIPPFLENGAHGYSLVQFHVAFQIIFGELMKKKNQAGNQVFAFQTRM
ncbi:uncharacterized protein LOC106151497 isoform X2 [Lingula anatina]|uniref:Uncharacterized protein LOC106151497 isoform X2 n=1 Tax=Lingula anatina TaxID=7574 RepID=A0A1S3H288_LINAN|nr:uncharacterized protein LOC106151497 isoform X2 [Lingula anatina]|eukprot:XP_013380245.1 uncharacterized protein LOC106151497 isoform X2 [Lingula anatina]